MAPLIFAAGVAVDGLGIIVAYLMSPVGFFDNVIVLIGLLHCVYCVVISLWMFSADWEWTAQKFGLVGLVVLAPGYMAVSPFLMLSVYSDAALYYKVALSIVFFTACAWCSASVALAYLAGFQNKEVRSSVYVEEVNYIRYLQRGDVAAREYLSIRLEPKVVWFLLGAALFCFVIYFRTELSGYFGVSILPLSVASLGLVVGTMFFRAAAMVVTVFFIFPARLYRETGKHVFVDLTSNPLGGIMKAARRPRRKAR